MTDFKSALLSSDATVHQAVEVIDRSQGKIALVVDANGLLVGTVTDGDVRRGLLHGVPFEGPVEPIVNRRPRMARVSEDKAALLARMRQDRLRQLPLVDEGGRLVGLETLVDLLQQGRRDNWVVLMAGGEGRRLRPLTETVPKPMLSVGPKPLLETIIESFIAVGFYKFFLSVNYKAEQIERHFGDGADYGAEIHYLREHAPLGTAGSLSLLPEKPTTPFIVMNADILTKLDFGQILDFHCEHKSAATMCVREYSQQVPYGVVKVKGHNLFSIEEKPIQRHFVNAGIYVLEPKVLDYVPDRVPMTMPSLFDVLLKRKPANCSVCPIREYWLDVGQMADFERANSEFQAVFDD